MQLKVSFFFFSSYWQKFFFWWKALCFSKENCPGQYFSGIAKSSSWFQMALTSSTVDGCCAINEDLFNLGRISALIFSKLRPPSFSAVNKIFILAATKKKRRL
uniref:Uncharacterized protein n=1 Tax=Ixodes ricinus TaxID=34613 RepID=A0A6B0UA94_IXORI